MTETTEVYFHIKQDSINIGEDKWGVNNSTTINLVATGTATSFQAKFEGKVGNTWDNIVGVKLQDLSTSNSMNTKDIIYQVDLTGFVGFRCNLVAVSGGNITIYGYAV